ncbi:P-loop containing nucleoside triphosphate hydrolase protein [Crepidotus variabilis]|uniref:P-loop containing nucleoside triphosphate hydrolase protein n=1 Tax=Crepidotus variabilis TaxID=179855 RepID=A0A9P6ELM0_9AGAR|nr:P-loop containing nucleoside triphosphate hydrolase protein [Crepidotus variabilis]
MHSTEPIAVTLYDCQQYLGTMSPDKPITYIVVVGLTGSGKTTFINQASGSDFAVGNSLFSCTRKVVASNPFPAGPPGQHVVLIDTPGFDPSDIQKSDKQILNDVANGVGRMYGAQTEKKFGGIIYLQRISDPRLGHTTTANIQRALRLVGKRAEKKVIIATSFWDQVGTDDGNLREEGLASSDCFRPTLRRGAAMMRFNGNADSARCIISHLLKRAQEMQGVQDIAEDSESERSSWPWKCW